MEYMGTNKSINQIRKGNFLMYHTYQSFGFLNSDKMEPSPLRLCGMGVEKRVNEAYTYHNMERAGFDGFLFQYTFEGSGIFETPKEKIVLEKGKAFLITFPDDSSYYLPAVKDHSWTYFYLHFTGTAAENFFTYITALQGNILTLCEDASCIRLFLEEFGAVKSGKQYQRYESGEFLYRFLTSLLRDLESPVPISSGGCVDEAIQWIQRNYSSPMTLSMMCEEIGVSLPHLTRQFHKQQGMAPMKYLTAIRLEHAIALLLNTTLSISQIAAECGFADGNYFTKVFRKALTITPTDYRKLYDGSLHNL